MDNAFRNIDPGGITLNADGSITFQNAELRTASNKLTKQTDVTPMADNFGSCTNGGTCTGSNLNCSNTGNCSGTTNVGNCRGSSPGIPAPA